jgi:Luciferase-like monooxygenase/Periplasmic binding protein
MRKDPMFPPSRIVCLTEETVETLYLLGEKDRIVGISGYVVRPPEARREKPRVSAFTSANIDKILALRPDLVVTFSDLQADIAADLIRRGINVHAFNQRSVAEILEMIRMQIGYFAVGIGPTVDPEWVRTVATTAERLGFSAIWAPEHVVLLEQYASKYPYSSGEFPAPTDTPIADPFTALAYAAACTSKIRLATGICHVPEHNPLVLAKTVATVDRLSDGRFIFGVSVGWLAEEFAALGVPFERRGQRTREYIEVMRKLWSGAARIRASSSISRMC